MPAQIKPAWLAQLHAIDSNARLSFNTLLGRWQFDLTSGDGILRAQWWGWFKNPLTGEPITPDPVTGLYPFRDLDDAAMDEACANLIKTFVGNPWDGQGTPRKEILRRHRANRVLAEAHRRRLTEELDARIRDRRNRILGNPQVNVPVQLLDEQGRPFGRVA
jgi:hypothetical protein